MRQLRPRADDRVRLRRRLDPAHRRRAVHPHGRDPAAAARQHRPARRRHHGAARARLASRAPPTSRRCSTCCPATSRCRTPHEHEDLDDFVAADAGDDGLLGQHARLHREPAQGVLGRRGDRRTNDFCFDYLPRLTGDHSQLPDGDGTDRRRGARATSSSARTRPSARPTRKLQRLGLANLDWLVVRDFSLIESADVVEGRPRDRDR